MALVPSLESVSHFTQGPSQKYTKKSNCPSQKTGLNPWILQSAYFQIRQLLSNVIQNPSQAESVEKVKLPGWQDKFLWDGSVLSGLLQDLEVAIEPLKRLAFPLNERWVEELEQGRVAVWVALFLSQLPNLKSLDLDFASWRVSRDELGSSYVKLLFAHALMDVPRKEELSSFSSLTSVSFSPMAKSVARDPAYELFNSKEISVLFYLPAVEEIQVFKAAQNGLSWLSPGKSSAKSLRTLNIHPGSRIRERSLYQILSATPYLETLKYFASIDIDGDDLSASGGKGGVMVCPDLSRALVQIKSSVKTLSLDFEHTGQTTMVAMLFDAIDWGIEGRLDSLASFANFESLEVPIVMLLGWKVKKAPKLSQRLPSSLKHLTLSDTLAGFTANNGTWAGKPTDDDDTGFSENSYEWTEDRYVDAVCELLSVIELDHEKFPHFERLTVKLNDKALYDPGYYDDEGGIEVGKECTAFMNGELPQRLVNACKAAGVQCDSDFNAK